MGNEKLGKKRSHFLKTHIFAAPKQHVLGKTGWYLSSVGRATD